VADGRHDSGATFGLVSAYGEISKPGHGADAAYPASKHTLASSGDLVGQFRVARAAGVSSAMRLIGKSPNPGSTEPR
jgi:hypothetical protein